jgi:hypothetical protein
MGTAAHHFMGSADLSPSSSASASSLASSSTYALPPIVIDAVRHLLLHAVTSEADSLLRDRHVDSLLLCALYAVCKLEGASIASAAAAANAAAAAASAASSSDPSASNLSPTSTVVAVPSSRVGGRVGVGVGVGATSNLSPMPAAASSFTTSPLTVPLTAPLPSSSAGASASAAANSVKFTSIIAVYIAKFRTHVDKVRSVHVLVQASASAIQIPSHARGVLCRISKIVFLSPRWSSASQCPVAPRPSPL